MIITLSGLAGAGKSTVKDGLAKALGLKKYSVGAMRGKMAMDRGMTIHQLNALGMTEAFTDKEVDEYQTELGKKEDGFVIDGRMSWYFIPQSIKVFLDVDPAVAAKRIYDDKIAGTTDRSDEPAYKDVEEAKTALLERTESDRQRYQKWYGVDYMDRAQYDLVIDTSGLKPEETLQKVLDFVASRPKAANS